MARGWKGRAACAAGGAALAALIFLFSGDVDLNLADEGFLWYGVQRVLAGRVPLRDFQSYDPGRYYWCAAWCAWLGSGVLALRVALAAFQALGLAAGLALLRRLDPRPLACAAGAVVLALWMFPRHKLFEPSLALVAVLAAVRLAEAPSLRRHFASGVLVGFLGLIGRNHVLYGAAGFTLLIAVLALRLAPGPLVRRLGAFALGGVAGMLPLLALLALVPGFGAAFLESVLFFSKEHGPNLPLPYPWPWRFGHEWLALPERVSLAAAFLLPVLAYGAGLVLVVRAARGRAGPPASPSASASAPPSASPSTSPSTSGAPRVLVAAACVGVFYAHHAAVRSDAAHLAQSLHPALVGALALPFAFGWRPAARWTSWGALALASWLAASATNPVWAGLRAFRRTELVACEVAGDRLRLAPQLARQVTLLGQAVERHVPAHESLFLAPGLCTLYAAWGRVSPVWGIYFLWPAEEAAQEEMLRSFEAGDLRWALIHLSAPDERAELLFPRTHPLVWGWLERRFERVPTPELPPSYLLLRRAR